MIAVVAAADSPCDFDSDLCQYTQDTTDDFDWTRDSGGTPTGKTGPTADHTTGTSSGTSAIGTLTVSVKDGGTTTPIWTRSGNQGDQWFSVAVSIPATGSYQVIFVGVRGNNAHGDIAIDDVSILQGACPDVDECVPRGGRGPCSQICTNTVGSFFCSCNVGYTLNQDGRSCFGVQCPPVPAPEHGAVTDGNSYQDVVQFTCDPGYQLIGHSRRRCRADGTWSGANPTCTTVQCPMLRAPEHGTVTGGNAYQDVVVYECNVGYQLIGHSRRTCQADGTWSGANPTCTAVQCPMLRAPEHGTVTGGNAYQDEVMYNCNPGYQLIGVSSRTCQADGTWTVENPTCIDITPTSVKTEAISSTEIELTWSLDNYTDQVKQYFVSVQQRGTTNVTTFAVGRSDSPSFTVQNLLPYTYYEFWVVADIGDFQSNRSEIISQRTQPGEPPAPEKPVLQDQTEVSSTTFPLEVKPTSERNGPIGCYHVVVVKSSSTDNLPDPEMLQPYKTLEEAKNSSNDNLAYIAMALTPDTVGASTTVTVGDGTVTSCNPDQAGRKRRALTSVDVYNQEYTNSPLEPDSSYTTSVRAFGQDDRGQPYFSASQYMDPVSTAPKPPDQMLIIIIASVCGGVVLLGIIAAALVCYCRKKKATKKADLSKRTGTVNKAIEMAPVDYDNINDANINDNNIEDADNDNVDNDNAVYDNVPPAPLTDFSTPIPASRLEEVYDHRHMNDNQVFNEEYESIPEEVSNSHDAHIRPENGNKNRFKNIFTYDHSRVVLTTLEGQPGSDFINANYIDGYNHPNMFIAAQGPLPSTINDFWKMIWEQDTATIVMVTNLKERNKSKCAQYWPTKDSMDYGNIRVTLEETTTLVDYVIRTFDIQKDEEPARTVTQFHFISWPDFGVPQSPLGMMKFIRRAKTSDPPGRGPIVVHCSAGVGRSGTFIAIEAMQEMMAAEGRVDVHGFIGQMRHNRHSMVQTVEQYEFIYRALLEQQLYGDTEVEVANIHRHMHKLKAPSANPNQLGYEAEFKKLTRIAVDQDNMKSANKQENKTKNRLVSIVPYDTSRVFLPKITGVSGSDYINASFIDGYRQRDGFIATQGPLPNTVETFWRMIWHWESYSIVMLTELEENGREKSAKYWPEDGQTYGKVRVELKNTEENEGYTLRTFLVSNTDKQESPRREIQQFHFHDWSATGVPRNASRVLDLIGQVQKQQMKSGNGPITVHCSNGAGRTGAFIALNTVLERVKAEGICDLFQTVKSMRYSRPHMVQTAEQYLFCYKAVMEYLDSFDDYANFQ
ncbi:PREDICTED: receptor-type tyrosine-protein phosphatase alpha-like [Branchiostoma belcheri]|uniref:protein-tyrosine-phosphatase n=1 Tax=Branchiostoma belcheri TaxID=7741 RepID=A0A6P4ZNM9_BRABE|nr:PREDICTED: receptor-type tyrosine-protein phosphatase alpha-like [Branchiostoma belcheri]